MLKQIYDETAANIKKAASWALANPIMAIAIVATAALAAGIPGDVVDRCCRETLWHDRSEPLRQMAHIRNTHVSGGRCGDTVYTRSIRLSDLGLVFVDSNGVYWFGEPSRKGRWQPVAPHEHWPILP